MADETTDTKDLTTSLEEGEPVPPPKTEKPESSAETDQTFTYKTFNELNYPDCTTDVVIHPDKFGSKVTSDYSDAPKEKKYNLKVNEADIEVMDLLSKHIGISRNTLINLLLERILNKWLFEVKDFDAKVLIARHADKLCQGIYSDIGNSWTNKVFKDIISEQLHWLRFYSKESPEISLSDGWETAHEELEELFEQYKEAKNSEDAEKVENLQNQILQISHTDSFNEILKKLKTDKPSS
jgi:hypothetical protein